MLKSIHSPIQRIAISTLTALAAITGSATSSYSQSVQTFGPFPSIAACEAHIQALRLANPRFRYWCEPLPGRQEPKKRKRLSGGTRVIDRNLRKIEFIVPEGWQRNHLIPDEIVRKNPLMIEARRRNLYDLDRPSNILVMPGTATARKARPDLIGHQGSHSKYSALINDELERASRLLIRRYGSLDNVPAPVLRYVIERTENRARTRILKNDVPTRFDQKTKTRVLSDAGLVEQELVG